MTRHWSARLLGATLALWFALAMVRPELVHECPLHNAPAAPAAAGHASGHDQHEAPPSSPASHEHCSCPQACCPVGVGVAMAPTPERWVAAVAPVMPSAPVLERAVLPGAPAHLLPFALAPPHALA